MEGELLRLGPIALYTYGTTLAASFLAGVVLAGREARRRGQDQAVVAELAAHLMVVGLVVGRLGYVFPDLFFYLSHPAELFQVSQGGLSYIPAFLAGTYYVSYFAKRRGYELWPLLDSLAPGLAAGLIIGSLGAVEVQSPEGAISIGALYWSPATLAFFTVEYMGLWYLAASRRRLADGCRFCQITALDAAARAISSSWAWMASGTALPHAISVVSGMLLFATTVWTMRRRGVAELEAGVAPGSGQGAASPRVARRRRLPRRRRTQVAATWFGAYILLVILMGQTRS